jgi:hypothetical protein
MALKRTRLSNREFDRKVRLWGLVIPVFVALISATATIVVSRPPSPPVRFEPTGDDRQILQLAKDLELARAEHARNPTAETDARISTPL